MLDILDILIKKNSIRMRFELPREEERDLTSI